MARSDWPLNQRLLWSYCLFLSCALSALSQISTRHGLIVPETMGLAAANSVWLTTVISPRDLSRKRIRLSGTAVATLVLMATANSAINLFFNLSVGETIRMAVGNGVFAVLVLWLRRVQQPRLTHWKVSGAADLWALLCATTGASLLILLIGATPGIYVGGQASWLESLWWVARNVTYVFIALACIPVVWRLDLLTTMWSDRKDSLRALALYAASALAIWMVFSFPESALTFLPLLPMIAAGLILRPLTCISVTGLSGLTAAALCGIPFFDCNYDAFLPMPIALDLLMVCCAFTALFLAYTREQRDRYSLALEERTDQLMAANQFMRHVHNSMDEGVIVFDHEGLSTNHNRAAVGLLQAPSTALSLQEWFAKAHSPDGTPATTLFEHSPAHEHGGTHLITTGDDAGEPKYLEAHICKLDPFHPLPSTVILLKDITAEYQQIDELRGFAASAAHDLRAPLTGLSGWLELAQGEVASLDHNQEALDAMRRVDRSAKALSAVIDDWLAYSVERRGNLLPSTVSLASVVDHLLPDFTLGTGAGRPIFDVDLEDQVFGDESLIRQVLANLISNSCKYAEPGRPPEIRIRSKPLAEEWVEVEVSDNGRGIPAADLKEAFTPFHRSSDTRNRTIRGSGLGLALCQRIVRRHHGEISIRPNNPQGITVTFTLPRAGVQETDASSTSMEAAR